MVGGSSSRRAANRPGRQERHPAPTPFADLSAPRSTSTGTAVSPGIAIDPDFATNGFVYLFFPYDSPGRTGAAR